MLVKSFAKINLSIDVGPRGDNGYHRVDMVMQQLSYHDDVTVEYVPSEPDCSGSLGTASGNGGSFDIEVSTNRYYLPVDRRNLAYQAAELMIGLVREKAAADPGDEVTSDEPVAPGKTIEPGKVSIKIQKRIPVAGGLAGGSGNGAAVLHALNVIWDLGLSLKELMDLGAKLGSDVPFCVMGQARANRDLPEYIRKDAMSASCARATGRGTELVPVTPFDSWMVISKPRFSVSTKEVYDGIDARGVTERPDNDRLVRHLNEKLAPGPELYQDFINVLEGYTLDQYPEVAKLKEKMLDAGAEFSLMSGSGPTVFGVFRTMSAARDAAEALRAAGLEAYWTRTTR